MLAAGDLIQITANGTTNDKHRLNNGDVFRVKGFKGEDVELSNGWVVGKDFQHWNHGYLSTSHGSQGRTVSRVLIVQSALSLPATNQTQAYVQSASRGREMAVVLTDSKQVVLEGRGASATHRRTSADSNSPPQEAFMAACACNGTSFCLRRQAGASEVRGSARSMNSSARR